MPSEHLLIKECGSYSRIPDIFGVISWILKFTEQTKVQKMPGVHYHASVCQALNMGGACYSVKQANKQ
jgi:hypothetical protein